MQIVLTRKDSDQWSMIDAPVSSYDALVMLVSRIYREARRPTTIRGLTHAMKAKEQPGTRPRAFIVVGDFEAKITCPGHPEFTARTYDGRPNVNIIPRNVPDLPRSVSGFSPSQ